MTTPTHAEERPKWTLEDGRVIRLITPDDLRHLQTGTPLLYIDGEAVTVGVDEIDMDTRGGYLAVGILER